MGKKKILVIEDDPAMLEALRIELTDAGYNVTTGEDGETGLQEAMSGKQDLIILDIALPKMRGLDVLGTLKKAKEQRVRKTPIIILTNLGRDVNRKKALELGAAEYFVKATTDLRYVRVKVDKILHVN